jgi:small subunit ribosomal protein S2
MITIPSLEELLKAGVHFGHRTSRWHPKMAPYIFGSRAGVHVIDVEKTQEILENMSGEIESLIANGGSIWFIGTKQQTQPIVEKYAIEAKMPFVNRRWLGGTFTNFETINKLIKEYLGLKDKREKGDLKKYTKLEQLQFDRKIDELHEKIGGLADVKDLPEAIFIVDLRHDKTAAVEARKRGVKVFAICDTNINPKLADVVIPANDDSVRAVSLITRLVAEAVNSGRSKQKGVAIAKKKAASEIEVALKENDKATVEELDLEVSEKLAKEKEELEKEASSVSRKPAAKNKKK